jgi:predicted kinase
MARCCRRIFTSSKMGIGENHMMNQEACQYLMMGSGEDLIVVDNTNTQIWEMEPYVKLAKKYGYKVVVVEVPHPPAEVAAERNSHGVPVEIIQRMIDRWEAKLPADWNDHAVRKVGE